VLNVLRSIIENFNSRVIYSFLCFCQICCWWM